MTRATINRTGRRSLDQKHVQLHLSQEGDRIHVTGKLLDLTPFEGTGGRVVLELYRRSDRYREELGPITASITVDREFERFASVQSVSCDVLLVGEGSLILAAARGIRPETDHSEGGTKSLLRVAPEDLDQVLWTLSLEEDGVTLNVNQRVSDWRGFVRDPGVAPLLLPEIVRQVARWVWHYAIQGDLNDRPVVRKWAQLLASYDIPVGEAIDQGVLPEYWIENVTQGFARRKRYADSWAALEEDD